jgi:hypothetical protein
LPYTAGDDIMTKEIVKLLTELKKYPGDFPLFEDVDYEKLMGEIDEILSCPECTKPKE